MIKLNDLQHHGIKGQKWGVRRFQNKDGSLTNAGKKRYNDGSDYGYGKDTKTINVKKIATTDNKTNMSNNRNDYDKALKTTKALSDSIDTVRKFKSDSERSSDPDMERRIRKNVTQMSDKELQQKVQRLNMEDNYTRMMMHREQLDRGESYVNKVLDVSSTALKGAATALTIAVALKQLKG